MKVPQYNGNQVNERNLPDVGRTPSASIESFGGGSGNVLEGAAKIANVANDIYQKEKVKADDIAVQEARNAATLKETQLLYSKDGALNKKGKDAFGQIQRVDEEYQKFSSDIMGSLTNDEQRAKFKKYNEEHYTAVNRTLTNHVSNEMIRHENNVASSLIDNESNAAALAYNDPNRINMALNTQVETLKKIGASNGWSPEELKQKKDQVISRTHAGVIKSFLDNDKEMDAEKYFNENKEFINDKEVLSQVEQQVEIGSIRKKSQEYTDNAMKKGLTESQALSQIPKDDAKLREQMESRVRTQYGLKESAKRADLENVSINTMNLIDGGKVTDLTKTSGWTQMNDNQRNALTNYLNAKVSGKAIQTDRNTYVKLQSLSPDEFMKLDMREYSDKLGTSDFKEFVDMQKKYRNGETKQFDTFLTDGKAVETVYKEAGLDTKDPNYAKFQLDVAREQQKYQETTGKKMNDQDLANLAKSRAKDIVIKKGWFFDDVKKKFELTPEDVENISYNDVPKDLKAKIEASLTRSKKPVTEKNVLETYKKYISK